LIFWPASCPRPAGRARRTHTGSAWGTAGGGNTPRSGQVPLPDGQASGRNTCRSGRLRPGPAPRALAADRSRRRAMATETAADLLIESLMDWNVDTIFGLPGDGINGIIEAL